MPVDFAASHITFVLALTIVDENLKHKLLKPAGIH